MQKSGWGRKLGVGKRNGKDRKIVPKRGNIKCKDLEKGTSLTCSHGRRKATITVSW